MQTALPPQLLERPEGAEADAILRSCVHCGFCTATCPTYQLLGDELDGPRGRIYLIKEVLEGATPSRETQRHLDRCLTCRACESTCPSGVRYARLLDIGREQVEASVARSWGERLLRRLLLALLPYPRRFGALLRLGQLFRPLLPAALKAKLPQLRPAGARPARHHARRVLTLSGCAQSSATPITNAATARVLDRLGIELRESEGCCGALHHHLNATEAARAQARRNIDAWWPEIESGAEAIVITATGCGVMVRDYPTLLQEDSDYREKAQRVADLAIDLVELVGRERLSDLAVDSPQRIAFHAPCTLQHGLELPGAAEALLTRLGFELTPVADAHLCCGSAGTYSLLQPELSQQLLKNKLEQLERGDPELIATANVGCQLHLESRAAVPVRHWIELVDRATDPILDRAASE